MIRNVTGPPVVGDDLHGRERELQQLWTALAGGENLLMLAPRRVGKTSLMRELQRDPRANWDVVYIDAEDARGASDLFARVIAELAQNERYRNWLQSGRLPHALRRGWTSVKHVKVLGVELEKAGFPLTDPSIRRMLDLLRDSVPYHVQLFFASLQNHCDGAPGALSPPIIDRCFEERLTGPEGTPHLDHYASRLEFVFDSPERELAYDVLARTSRHEHGILRSEVAPAAGEQAARTGEVLQALEADGYLERREDRFAFQSNLVRVWWRKHRGAES